MKVILERLMRVCVPAFLILTATASFAQSGYTVVARGLDSKVLQKVVVQNGVTNVHAYTELATGMNYTNGYGQLVEAQEQIALLPNGGASATQGRHKVYFPGDIGSGVLQVVTPDGRNLYSRPLGVSYDDGSNTVFIATLTNAVGYLTSSNQVTYRNCFNGIQADLVCTYKRGGFECDLVFRAQPPTPDQFGLDADFTTLQLVTEFFNTQDPQQIPSTSDEWYGLQDSTLKFGKLTMKRGKAFATRSNPNAQSPVYKSWVDENGRKFLIEQVPLVYLAGDLDGLPLMSQAAPAKTRNDSLMSSNHRQFPAANPVMACTNQILLASADWKREAGVVLDYNAVSSSENYTFQANTTYFVPDITVFSGTITFENGTVIKGGELDFDFCTNLICATDANNPVILTSPNDDTEGDEIDGSTSTPSVGEGTFLGDFPDGMVLRNLLFCYSQIGVEGWGSIQLWDCQFYSFNTAVLLDCDQGNGRGELYNILFSQGGSPWDCDGAVVTYGGDVIAEQVTVDHIGSFFYDESACSGLYMTNCLITDSGIGNAGMNGVYATNCTVYLPSLSPLDYSKVYDNRYQLSAYGVYNANYYLASNSIYRNIGTTAIDPDLLNELRIRTTFAPQEGGWPDNDGMPDLGYHYPVDQSLSNDGVPYWWLWQYFGNYNETATNLDASGNTLLSDYQNGLDPNVIQFSIWATNNYVNTTAASVQLNVIGGTPAYYALFVNSTTTTNWQPFTATNFAVSLGDTDGSYRVVVGLKGIAPQATETWEGYTFTLDRVAPVLAVSNPTISGGTATVCQPWLQLFGRVNEDLSRLSYDLTNAAGVFTNQDAFVVDCSPPTNLLQAYDVPLTNGVNGITLRVVDLAGNVTATNFNVVLDYSGATNPTIQLTWPQNGKELCGDKFTVRGWTEDAAASVTAVITDNNGDTNIITGEVERTGRLWAEHLPLNAGTNWVTLTVMNAAGLSSTTNFMVVKSGMTFVLTSINGDLWQPFVSVGGIVSDHAAAVWCNGVQGTNYGNGTWSATNVPVTPGGMACFDFSTIPPGQDDPGGNTNVVKQPEIQTYYYSESKTVEADHPVTGDMEAQTEWGRNYTADTNGNFTLTSSVHDAATWLSCYWPYDDTYVFSQTATNNSESYTDNLYGGGYTGTIRWIYGTMVSDDYNAAVGTALNIPDEDVRDYFRSIYSGPDWIYHFYADNVEKQYYMPYWYENMTLKVDARTKQRLLTGGKAGSGKTNLFCLTVDGRFYSGNPISNGAYRTYWPDGAPWEEMQSTPFPDKTQLQALGKHFDADGNLWVVLPDNIEPDLGLMAKGFQHYNLTVSPAKERKVLLDFNSGGVDSTNLNSGGTGSGGHGGWLPHRNIIPVNDGDADQDSVPDFADGFDMFGNDVPAANGLPPSRSFTVMNWSLPTGVDRTKAKIRFLYSGSDPAGLSQTAVTGGGYTYTPAAGTLRIWGKDGTQFRLKERVDQVVKTVDGVDIRGDYVAPNVNPNDYYDATNVPNPLYLEGIQPSGRPLDQSIQILCDPDGQSGFLSVDTDYVTVDQVDLDVDSDNNNGTSSPDRSAYEDSIEDMPNMTGKIVVVNDGDTDGDGIPGFADGFNWSDDGDPTNPDYTSTNDIFVPVVLQLSPAIDLTKAHLRLTYDSSDPAGVTSDGGSPAQWTPAGGSLRLWKKPGNQHRDFHPADDPNTPGDYLPGQTEIYSNLTQLGFSTGNLIVTNYLEGIRPSGSGGDKEITVEIDPLGNSDWLVTDAIRVTVVDLRLKVDANRDGQIMDDMSDVTTLTKPYRFWVNNDHDANVMMDNEYPIQEDLIPSSGSDADSTTITCTRDLEDYTRLWIKDQGIDQELQGGILLLALEWKDTTDSPQIRVFPAFEPDGGTLYVTDLGKAQSQTDAPYGTAIADQGGRQAVASGTPFLLPTSFWSNPASDFNKHLLFDAISAGSGKLVISLYKSDATTKVVESDPLYLNLKDIKNMYERWTVDPSTTEDSNGGVTPNTTARISTARPPSGFQYATSSPEENKYILFVHGWNMAPWEKDAFAETAFKRLWWQRYKGRFGSFQWPVTYGFALDFGIIPNDPRSYDNGEFVAWQSATGLLNKLNDLNNAYPGQVYLLAHSMGNVVAGEALRKAGASTPVNTYVAAQAAIPTHVYDTNGATHSFNWAGFDWDSGTPNCYSNYWTSNAPCYFNGIQGAQTFVNFFNENDYALTNWIIDQDLKPDHGIAFPGYYYTAPPTSHPTGFYYIAGSQDYDLYFPGDTYKVFAYADEARSYALGATANVNGFTAQPLAGVVWPSDPFGDGHFETHPWHSAEFLFSNMEQKNFWHSLLDQYHLLPSP